MQAGVALKTPNYVIIYGAGCFIPSGRRGAPVALYDRYRDRVHFVVVDLDRPQSAVQQQLVQKHYGGSILDVIILDREGHPIYDQAGEVQRARVEQDL